jgi:hypothetical protein
MKRKSDPSILRRNPKDEIINRARKGVFDRNPLLVAPHELCKVCGCKRKIAYLDHLKSGRFQLWETQMIEVSYAAPTILGLSHAMERITPIIMTVRCKKCGNRNIMQSLKP